MSAWNDVGRNLFPDELRRLLRDACAMLGKCNADAPPATVLAQSPDELRFDNPPLRDRPNHQKQALVYVVVLLLNDANIYISPRDLPRNYFTDKASDPLESTIEEIGQAQEYPAHLQT